MSANELIPATIDAAQSGIFYVPYDRPVSVMTSPDLAGVEKVTVQITHDNGETWVDYLDGATVQLTSSENAIRLYGPMTYRVNKDVTASSTGVYWNLINQ